MEISSINSVKNVSQNFGNQQAQSQPSDVKSKPIDNSKVWKYLGTAAAVAAAGIGIGYAIKNGKIKNLNLGDFKKLGKFDKGKAIYNNKLFTGTISTGTHKITYLGGKLARSENSKTGLMKIYDCAFKTNNGQVFSNLTMLKDKSGKLLKVWQKNENKNVIMDFVKEKIIRNGDVIQTKADSQWRIFDALKQMHT